MTEDVSDLRKAELKKLRDALLRCRGKSPFSTAAYEALRDAADVGAYDDPYRAQATGYCMGIRRALLLIGNEPEIAAYREAMNCAALLLACKNAGMVRGMFEQTADAVALLQKVD